MRRGGDGRQVFDWVLDRNARRASGLALVMVVALLGSWLAVEAVVRWRESERSVERARLLDQTAQARMAQVQGGGALEVDVCLVGAGPAGEQVDRHAHAGHAGAGEG